jgi:Crinkler effector protein N-terminal domain
MVYTLLCIIIGETTLFSVKINETQLVDELKDAIKKKAEPKLDAFAAHELTLYQVEIDASNEACIEEVKSKCKNLSQLSMLNPVFELGDCFDSSGPLRRAIHILVEPPRGELCTGAKLDMMLTRSGESEGCQLGPQRVAVLYVLEVRSRRH